MKYRCAKCTEEIHEFPFYKLKYSNDSFTEIYLCAPCVREWTNSWPQKPPKVVPEVIKLPERPAENTAKQPKLTEVRA